MSGTMTLLELAKANGLAEVHLRGLLHIAIGRTVRSMTGKKDVLSTGLTWRELAELLKACQYDRAWVAALGLDPEALAAKDREKFWYQAISQARVDSAEARIDADRLAALLKPLGYTVDATASVPSRLAELTSAPAEPAEGSKQDATQEEPPPAPKRRKKKGS